MSRRTLGLPPKLLALFSAVALSACGGGGGGGGSSGGGGSGSGPVVLQPGVYDARLEFVVGTPEDVVALVSRSGKLIFFNGSTALTSVDLVYGSQSSVSGSGVTVRFSGGNWTAFQGTLSGTVNSAQSARLQVSSDGTVITLVRDNDFTAQGVTLTDISGSYNAEGGGALFFNIAPDGGLTGGNGGGNCAFNGQVTIPDESVNLFEVTYNAANCTDSELNGDFVGLGTFFPDASAPDGIIFATTDEEVGGVFFGKR